MIYKLIIEFTLDKKQKIDYNHNIKTPTIW